MVHDWYYIGGGSGGSCGTDDGGSGSCIGVYGVEMNGCLELVTEMTKIHKKVTCSRQQQQQ